MDNFYKFLFIFKGRELISSITMNFPFPMIDDSCWLMHADIIENSITIFRIKIPVL